MLVLARLVVKFSSQLSVLNDCQLGGALELIFLGDGVLHPHLSDLHQHLFTQLICLLNYLLRYVLDDSFLSSLLLIYILSPEVSGVLDLWLLFDKLVE